MTSGRTVLIRKDPSKGTIPGNYRPITCLLLLWKILISVIAKKLYKYLEAKDLIGSEQKGCRGKKKRDERSRDAG